MDLQVPLGPPDGSVLAPVGRARTKTFLDGRHAGPAHGGDRRPRDPCGFAAGRHGGGDRALHRLLVGVPGRRDRRLRRRGPREVGAGRRRGRPGRALPGGHAPLRGGRDHDRAAKRLGERLRRASRSSTCRCSPSSSGLRSRRRSRALRARCARRSSSRSSASSARAARSRSWRFFSSTSSARTSRLR